MITDSEEQLKWYIQLTNGELKGPFVTSDTANATMLAEGISGDVVQRTNDGKQVLFG